MARSQHLLTALVAMTTSAACIVVLGVMLFGEQVRARRGAEAADPAAAARQSAMVDRTRKSDRLPLALVENTRTPIATVEVVGIRNAAIVYRDRSGNILFKTDPIANVTVVAKNVELPELTLRETPTSEVVKMSIDARRSKPLSGCESAFARPSPEVLTERNDRCLAERAIAPARLFAGLD
jgi:hypothetical protein